MSGIISAISQRLWFEVSTYQMNRRISIKMSLVAAIGLGLPMGIARAETEMQQPTPRDFCFTWKFTKGEPAGAQQSEFDDSGWKDIHIPHDWSIEGPKDSENPGGS